MRLPDDVDRFVESVMFTGQKLIERGFWEIPKPRFDKWCSQFFEPQDKFFAACLLDQTIFRSKHQFESALRSLFRSNLNGKVFQDEQDIYLMELLKSHTDPKIRLVPVIGDTDPPTKSGPLVIRRLQRVLQLNSNWMCWPWQVQQKVDENKVTTIIFVDDFLGSGHQFEKFYNQWKFGAQETSDIRYFYAPVVAHQQGLDYMSEKLPSVSTVCVETLGEVHGFFYEKTWEKICKGEVTAAEAKKWYIDFSTKHNIQPKNIGPFGYGDLELAFGFNHSTPNNTLPILWYVSDKWQPLLER